MVTVGHEQINSFVTYMTGALLPMKNYRNSVNKLGILFYCGLPMILASPDKALAKRPDTRPKPGTGIILM